MHHKLIAVFCTLLCVGVASAQTCDPIMLGRFGGDADFPPPEEIIDIQVADGVAYGSVWGGLFVLDVRDPTDPRPVSFIKISDRSTETVEIAKDRLYLGGDKLRIFDISEPLNPVLIGEHGEFRFLETIEVEGDLLFLGLGNAGTVLIADASDPTRLEILGQYDAATFVRDLAVRGSILYVLAGPPNAMVQVVDVSEPSEPVFLDMFTDNFRSIHQEADVLYGAAQFGIFEAFDISDPASPVLLGSWSDSFLYDSIVNFVVFGEIAFLAQWGSEDGYGGLNPHALNVIDVSDPTNMRQIGEFPGLLDIKGTFRPGMDIWNGVGVLTGSPEFRRELGLVTFDFSDPCYTCPGDIDGDNDSDADDFFAYLDAFAAGNGAVCDIDEDGDCDAEDFFGYLDQFAQGC